MKLLTTTTAAVLVSAGMASAAPVDFDFAANPPQEFIPGFSMSSGGISVSVSGMSCTNGVGPNGACRTELIDRWQNGVGIDILNPSMPFDNRGRPNIIDDKHQVDGWGRDEFVMLEYTKEVILKSVSFNYYTNDDEFRLYTWDGLAWIDEGEFDACTSGCFSNAIERVFNFTTEYSGSKFLIGAVGWNDDWKFRSTIVSEKSTTPPPPIVPLPAAGWLLLGGLGGIAALRARKSS